MSRSKVIRRVLTMAIVLLALAYVAVSLVIGAQVRSSVKAALQACPGDKIAALMSIVESERYDMRERNRAVWALGQLGDPRALPVLERHYTGDPSDEGRGLSQYRLKKAIALCKGATNISALVWRHGDLDVSAKE